MKRITVLLTDDSKVVRREIRRLLEFEDDIEVVGEANNGRQAVGMTIKFCPAVVLMDIALPLINGLEATRQLLEVMPGTNVLILSAHSDDAYVQAAINSGAAGFLVKRTSAPDVCRAIREVQKGTAFSARLSPVISTNGIKSHKGSSGIACWHLRHQRLVPILHGSNYKL